jgi:glycerol-3-phosphate dehydrogenase
MFLEGYSANFILIILYNLMNPDSTICICGAGTMGSGIALAAASSGFYAIL